MSTVKTISVRGIAIEIDDALTDDDGVIYSATVDGETVAEGRDLVEAEENARAWAQ